MILIAVLVIGALAGVVTAAMVCIPVLNHVDEVLHLDNEILDVLRTRLDVELMDLLDEDNPPK